MWKAGKKIGWSNKSERVKSKVRIVAIVDWKMIIYQRRGSIKCKFSKNVTLQVDGIGEKVITFFSSAFYLIYTFKTCKNVKTSINN